MRPLVILCLILTLTFGGCAVVDIPRSPDPTAPLPETVWVGGEEGGRVVLNLRSLVERGTFSSGFGWRGLSLGGGASARHQGIDIAAPKGTPVRAAGSGTVVDIGTRGDYGRFILIRHASNLETAYGHLSHTTRNLRVGGPVKQGDVIGYVGATGRATGPHLHFEVRRDGAAVDPLGLPRAPAGTAQTR